MKIIEYNGFRELVPEGENNWIKSKKFNIVSKSISLGKGDTEENYTEITEDEAVRIFEEMEGYYYEII